MPKKIDLSQAPRRDGTLYPPPFDAPCRARRRVRVGDAAGLTQFGVNVCTLPPGTWSSQRHWHSKEDELIGVLSGEVVLVTDEGEEILRAGDWAGFKAGEPNGHSFQNRSGKDVVLIEIGSRFEDDEAFYPDIDMRTVKGQDDYFHRDGKTSYGPQPRRT
ncbi:MAG TPA: cupin domain-containing protein [Bauldia sp.]|nr:cupin domain-containing protein [Bauldia sp.]